MDISQFIDNVVAGNAAAAKENLNDILSAKAFESIDGQKKELAHTLFGGQEQSDEEVTDDEEAYAEEKEYDGEQLDEISFSTANRAMRARSYHTADDFHPDLSQAKHNPKNYTKSGESKDSLNKERMIKKFGNRAVNRIQRIHKAYGEE